MLQLRRQRGLDRAHVRRRRRIAVARSPVVGRDDDELAVGDRTGPQREPPGRVLLAQRHRLVLEARDLHLTGPPVECPRMPIALPHPPLRRHRVEFMRKPMAASWVAQGRGDASFGWSARHEAHRVCSPENSAAACARAGITPFQYAGNLEARPCHRQAAAAPSITFAETHGAAGPKGSPRRYDTCSRPTTRPISWGSKPARPWPCCRLPGRRHPRQAQHLPRRPLHPSPPACEPEQSRAPSSHKPSPPA